MMIPVFEPSFNEADIQAVSEVLRSGWLNEHNKTQLFEKQFGELNGTEYAVATTSGTTALFLALKAAGVNRHSRVAIPDYTAIGTARAIQLSGALAVLVDVDRETGNIDIEQAKRAVTSHVIVVHNNGHACDLAPLLDHFGRRRVIEDACQSLGSKRDGHQLGTFADMGCFSLATTKIVTAGQGGVVVTNDEKLYKLIQRLKNQGNFRGVDPPDTYLALGYNFKWTEMNAALALSQMTRLEMRLFRMKLIDMMYSSKLGDYMPSRESGEVPWRITVKTNSRGKVIQHMRENGVGVQPFSKPLHAHFGFKGFPNATKYALNGLYLPSSPSLKEEEVDYICDKLLEVLE